MITFTLVFWSKPSIWFSSSIRIRCTSLRDNNKGIKVTKPSLLHGNKETRHEKS